jgi:hypothetical protein
MRALKLIPVVLLLLAGCTSGDKQFTEREVNRFGMQQFIGHRSGRVRANIAVLEELRHGSVSNAIERLESDLDGDIEQLRIVLRQADVSDDHLSKVRTALSRAEAYRTQFPRATKEQTK